MNVELGKLFMVCEHITMNMDLADCCAGDGVHEFIVTIDDGLEVRYFDGRQMVDLDEDGCVIAVDHEGEAQTLIFSRLVPLKMGDLR